MIADIFKQVCVWLAQAVGESSLSTLVMVRRPLTVFVVFHLPLTSRHMSNSFSDITSGGMSAHGQFAALCSTNFPLNLSCSISLTWDEFHWLANLFKQKKHAGLSFLLFWMTELDLKSRLYRSCAWISRALWNKLKMQADLCPFSFVLVFTNIHWLKNTHHCSGCLDVPKSVSM